MLRRGQLPFDEWQEACIPQALQKVKSFGVSPRSIQDTLNSVLQVCYQGRENLRNQGIANNPTAKKKLNKNSMTVATRPAEVEPFQTVPARIAMQAHWPAAAKSISFRLPSLSMIQIGMSDEKKYATPLKPARRRARSCERPTDSWKMVGA